jgi:hypothetical protein
MQENLSTFSSNMGDALAFSELINNSRTRPNVYIMSLILIQKVTCSSCRNLDIFKLKNGS